MFNNRRLSVTLEKKPKPRKDAPGDSSECTHVDVDKLSQLAYIHSQNLAKIAGAVYIGKKLIDTACQIAVIAAQAKLK